MQTRSIKFAATQLYIGQGATASSGGQYVDKPFIHLSTLLDGRISDFTDMQQYWLLSQQAQQVPINSLSEEQKESLRKQMKALRKK